MKKIKNFPIAAITILLLCFAAACLLFTACGNSDVPAKISSRDYTYVGDSFKLIAVNKNGGEVKGAEFIVKEGNGTGAVINGSTITATRTGTAVIAAKGGGAESEPQTLCFLPKKDTLTQKLTGDIGIDALDLGKQYSLEIEALPQDAYTIESSNTGVLEITPDKKLNVVGIGIGDLTVKCNKDGATVYDGKFSVYNSLLVNQIKRALIAKGTINSLGSQVSSTQLKEITELNLDDMLYNDPTIFEGVRVLPELRVLSAVNNRLSDLSPLSGLKKLEQLNAGYNRISDISAIGNLSVLEKLDLSHNEIANISPLTYLQEITELNLNDNKISNIGPLSNLYGCKSLDLGKNKISDIDAISSLGEIRHLSLAYAELSSSKIFGLTYLNKLESADFSGIKFESLSSLGLSKSGLKSLSLNDCASGTAVLNITPLLEYTGLKSLAIAGNNLTWAEMKSIFVDGSGGKEPLKEIEELSIGGNKITDVPDLSALRNLSALDLSGSRNLDSLANLSLLSGLRTLVLDNCRSISSSTFLTAVQGLNSLRELSAIDGLNYINKAAFTYLTDKVGAAAAADSFRLRLFENEWITPDSLSGFKSAFFFSKTDLLGSCTKDGDNYILPYSDSRRQIVINLIDDLISISNANIGLTLTVPKGIAEVKLVGYKNYTASNLNFIIATERKESDITFSLYNFKFAAKNDNAGILSASNNTVYVKLFGEENAIRGGNGTGGQQQKGNPGQPAIKAYDLTVVGDGEGGTAAAPDLTLTGGSGGTPAKPSSASHGFDGGKGGDGVTVSNLLTIEGYKVFAINGGKGGNGSNGTCWTFSHANGGNGGAGGNGVTCAKFYNATKAGNLTMTKGAGGSGGSQDGALGLGKNGSKGSDGSDFSGTRLTY